MLSSPQIQEHIAFISTELGKIADNRESFAGCVEIHRKFQALRDQYRQAPGSMTDRVSELTGLSRRFDALLTDRLRAAVDRYHVVCETLRQMEDEKAFWREYLIRAAAERREQRLQGDSVAVRVRSVRSRSIPAANTAERTRLEELLRASGHWNEVSQLARTRLDRAMNERLFPPEQAAAIEEMCPIAIIHQVAVERSESPQGR